MTLTDLGWDVKANCLTNNNHLPPASLCAELGDAKKKHINDGLTLLTS